MITPDSLNLQCVTVDRSSRKTVHLARTNTLFLKLECGINAAKLGWLLTHGSIIRSYKDIQKKVTCKRCKGKFDGTISKQNSKNARKKANHPEQNSFE